MKSTFLRSLALVLIALAFRQPAFASSSVRLPEFIENADCEAFLQSSVESLERDIKTVNQFFDWIMMTDGVILNGVKKASIADLFNLIHLSTGFYVVPHQKDRFFKPDGPRYSFFRMVKFSHREDGFFKARKDFESRERERLVDPPVVSKKDQKLSAIELQRRRKYVDHLLANVFYFLDVIGNNKALRVNDGVDPNPHIGIEVRIAPTAPYAPFREIQTSLNSIFSLEDLAAIGTLTKAMKSDNARIIATEYLFRHLETILAARDGMTWDFSLMDNLSDLQNALLMGTNKNRIYEKAIREEFFRKWRNDYVLEREKNPLPIAAPESEPRQRRHLIRRPPNPATPTTSQIDLSAIDNFVANPEMNLPVTTNLNDFSISKMLDHLHIANSLLNTTLSQIKPTSVKPDMFKAWWEKRESIDVWISDFNNALQNLSRETRQDIAGLEATETRLESLKQWAQAQLTTLEELNKSRPELEKLSVPKREMLSNALEFSQNTFLNISRTAEVIQTRLTRDTAWLRTLSQLEIQTTEYHRRRVAGDILKPDELPLIEALRQLSHSQEMSALIGAPK
jgi:hypothetical protein